MPVTLTVPFHRAGRRGAAVGLAVVLLAAGCGSGGGGSDAEPPRPEARPETTTAPVRSGATTREEVPSAEDPLTLDDARVRCQGIDLVAIGDLASTAPPGLEPFSARFVGLSPPELAKPALVCARPIERWRDVVIQRLFTSSHEDGVLITDAAGGQPVLRFTNAEWETYKFRGQDDDATSHNFSGPPRGRTTFAGAEVILTTRGGIVMERPDSYGAAVLNAVWTYWHDEGGYLRVGLPTSAPSADPAIDGVYQDFTKAWGRLPGVLGATEAEAVRSTDAFVFTDVADPEADRPAGAEGDIIQTTGTSWFLDQDGVRHWIDSVEAFDCAVGAEGAEEIEVRGWVSASYELGDPYECPPEGQAIPPG
ncbi:hypothetical protein BH10ACT1_BH10ACT1_26970 [soil metagenome]